MSLSTTDVLLFGTCGLAIVTFLWVCYDTWTHNRAVKRINAEWEQRQQRAKAQFQREQEALSTPIPYDPDPEGGLDLGKLHVHHEPDHWHTYNAKGQTVPSTAANPSSRGTA